MPKASEFGAVWHAPADPDPKASGPAPAGSKPKAFQSSDSHRQSSEAASSQGKSSGPAPAGSVPMFKPRSADLEGKNIVRQGNALLKLARLAWSGDSRAASFLPPFDGTEWLLPDVLLTPVWFHNFEDKRFGQFHYENGPFVNFRWRDLWEKYVDCGVPKLDRDPFEGRDMLCSIEFDPTPAAQPWVNGMTFNFKFTGV